MLSARVVVGSALNIIDLALLIEITPLMRALFKIWFGLAFAFRFMV